ncbi:glycerol-3-phosphate dehydrogenase/oxidase [Occallatibacter savannae]|uniref:glycerol-3-phosphate dehydrogenase/oxidase n=1 Tax=Occallatibacter savannae TaxID=1002691 RepID=UPI000D689D7B|nr:glycerol-3-phosphate dehydrogenase/oxidase [Occallatibacter savannae]
MRREEMLRRIRERAQRNEPWDIAVIGGGATGMGVAVDAAARGFQAVLLEAHDFGKGTSSRSTKLVHGGVRYLEQGNIPLVMSALKERGLLRQNAPHLVKDLAFVVPNYSWWEAPFYGIGLKLYDLLAGKYGFGASKLLTKEETLQRLPALEPEELRGGVVYYDGQFDDSRLLIHLAMTAADQGATVINYCPATGLLRDDEGYVNGLIARDDESGEAFSIKAKIVINATGVFTDQIRRMADPATEPLMVTSQGIHLVFDRSFLKGDTALMVPRTSDGRVLFVIPWHGHAVAGTTDTPVDGPSLEPKPLDEEIQFILETAGRYLTRPPSRSDVLAVYVGLRPLVKSGGASSTSAISRDHTIHVDTSGLLTITGGKWTTYRHMAEDTVDHAITLGRLRDETCVTKNLRIHGYAEPPADRNGDEDPLEVYGSDSAEIRSIAEQNPDLAKPLHPALPYIGAEVVWAARAEMARTVEDVLSRRTRALFLNAHAAMQMAEPVAKLLAQELHHDDAWVAAQLQEFSALAKQYTV